MLRDIEVWGKELATLDIVSIASEIAEAGTALAGLILVYLGAVAGRYETLMLTLSMSALGVKRTSRIPRQCPLMTLSVYHLEAASGGFE